MKNHILFLGLLLLLVSCRNENPSKEISELDKAIELIENNNAIGDTLKKLRKNIGAKFIFCYIINKDNRRILSCQVMQSDIDDAPPLNIDRPYKIKTIQGIDILFEVPWKESDKDYKIKPDKKTDELIAKRYLTTDNRRGTYCTLSYEFVFCKSDDNIYKIIAPDFQWKEEMKAREEDRPSNIENFYPACK